MAGSLRFDRAKAGPCAMRRGVLLMLLLAGSLALGQEGQPKAKEANPQLDDVHASLLSVKNSGMFPAGNRAEIVAGELREKYGKWFACRYIVEVVASHEYTTTEIRAGREIGKFLEPEFTDITFQKMWETQDPMELGRLLLLLRLVKLEYVNGFVPFLSDKRTAQRIPKDWAGAIPLRVCDLAFNDMKEAMVRAGGDPKRSVIGPGAPIASRDEGIAPLRVASTPAPSQPAPRKVEEKTVSTPTPAPPLAEVSHPALQPPRVAGDRSDTQQDGRLGLGAWILVSIAGGICILAFYFLRRR